MPKMPMDTQQNFNITERVYNATSEDFDIISGTAAVTGCWNCIAIFSTTTFNNDTTSILVANYTPNNSSPALNFKDQHRLDTAIEGINLYPLQGVVPNGFMLPKMFFVQLQISGGILIAFK